MTLGTIFFSCSFCFLCCQHMAAKSGGRDDLAPPRHMGVGPLWPQDNAVFVVCLPFACRQAARTWLKRTWSLSILYRLRTNIRVTMIRATFLPCLAVARLNASW